MPSEPRFTNDVVHGLDEFMDKLLQDSSETVTSIDPPKTQAVQRDDRPVSVPAFAAESYLRRRLTEPDRGIL